MALNDKFLIKAFTNETQKSSKLFRIVFSNSDHISDHIFSITLSRYCEFQLSIEKDCVIERILVHSRVNF